MQAIMVGEFGGPEVLELGEADIGPGRGVPGGSASGVTNVSLP